MTSCHWHAFCITGPLWWESTGYRWSSPPRTRNAELWYFLDFNPNTLLKLSSGQWLETPWRSCDVTGMILWFQGVLTHSDQISLFLWFQGACTHRWIWCWSLTNQAASEAIASIILSRTLWMITGLRSETSSSRSVNTLRPEQMGEF